MTTKVKRANILIVEDDQWMADHTRRILESSLQCYARIAPNGIEAMDEVDRRRPDVIILDMFMPGPNGLVLLHELQSHDDLSTIPVILCSNSITDLPTATLQEYGVVATLDKTTMRPEDIVSAIRKVLP